MNKKILVSISGRQRRHCWGNVEHDSGMKEGSNMNGKHIGLLLALLLLLAVLASCGSDATPTPIVVVVTPESQSEPVTVVVTPPPPEPQAGIQIREAVFAHGLGEQMQPLNPGDDFQPAETVYLSLRIAGRPEMGLVTARFYWRDTLIAEAGVDLADANSGLLFSIGEDTYAGYTLTHEQPFPLSDNYHAEVFYDDQSLGAYPFRVVSPPEAIPSQVKQVTLARGADEDYNPVEPTTAFAFDEMVYLVARGDLGTATWLQADWYVNGQLDETGTRSLTMEENAADVGLAFSFLPEGGWPPGEHFVILTMNDREVERYTFTIVSSSDALPSTPAPAGDLAPGPAGQPGEALPEPTEAASDLSPGSAGQPGETLPKPTPSASAPPIPTLPPAPETARITPANVQQLAEVHWTHVGRNTQDLAWSPDSRWLAVSESSHLYLYEAATLNPVALPHEVEANRLVFSPDGTYLAVTRYVGPSPAVIDLWRVADWALVRTLEGHPNTIIGLAFSPDGQLLASGSMDSSVRVWNVTTGELMHDWKVAYQGVAHPPAVLSVAFDPGGQQIVAGVYGGTVQGWQMADGVQSINFQASGLPQPNQVLFLPNGNLVTLNGSRAKVWQLDGMLLAELESELGVYGGDLSPGGQLLATIHSEGIELWDVANRSLVHQLQTGSAQKVAFSPDGGLLATLEGDDDLLRLWGVAGGATPKVCTPKDNVTKQISKGKSK